MRLLIPAVFAAFSVLAGGVTAAAAQSLADVARQEEERKKTVKQAGKVYTNKDLSSAPAPSSSPPANPAGPAAAPAVATTEGEAAKAKEPPKDQAYWAGRMKTLREQADRDQVYADALQTRVNSLNNDLIARDDPAQRAVLTADLQKALDELSRLKLAVESGKKAIADLEEEARRAGVPPGWLR